MSGKRIVKKLVCWMLVTTMVLSVDTSSIAVLAAESNNIELQDDIDVVVDSSDEYVEEVYSDEEADAREIQEIEAELQEEEILNGSVEEIDETDESVLLQEYEIDEGRVDLVEPDFIDYNYIDSLTDVDGLSISDKEVVNIEEKLCKMSGFYQVQTYRRDGADTVGQCTNNSKQNLYKRRIYFEEATGVAAKKNDWEKITHNQNAANTIAHTVVNKSSHHLSTSKVNKTNGIQRSELKKLLKAHPEGVYYFNSEGDKGHALVITRCDEAGILYGVDPVNVKSGVEKKLYETHLFTSSKYKVSSEDNDTVWRYLENPPAGRTITISVVKCKEHPKDIVLCDHSYSCGKNDTKAKCNNCGSEYDHEQNKDNNFIAGTYAITGTELNLYNAPYSGASTKKFKLFVGDKVKISYAVVNAFGNVWGRVEGDMLGNEKGWICIKDKNEKNYKFPLIDSVKATVDFKNFNSPSKTLKLKESFPVSGTIKAEGSTIKNIKSYFINKDNKKFQEHKIENYNKYTYDVTRGCSLDKNLKFGSLTSGTYKYVIEVTLTNGKIGVYNSKEFSVGTASAVTTPKPSITFVESYVGGVRYKISNGNNEINYSIDGGKTYKKCTGSTTVNITSNTTIYAWSGKSSNVEKMSVTVGKVATPTIKYTQEGDSVYVSVSVSGDYSDIYYRSGYGTYQKYKGAFVLNADNSVFAYAEKKGMRTSDTTSKYIQILEPSVPVLSMNTKADIAEGDAIELTFSKDTKVKKYELTVNKDGELWKRVESDSPYVVINTDGFGEYSISGTVSNRVGTVKASNKLTVNAHKPLTVTFYDYDKTSVIDTPQVVRYGYSAVKPLTPKRKGYTFSGWNGNYTNVTEDTDVVAEYEINSYIVKFHDCNGDKIGEQEVEYDKSVDPDLFVDKVTIDNEGRQFVGWEVFDAKDPDSALDITHVDSDMSVRGVTKWTNKDLPCLITDITCASADHATEGTVGFKVGCKVSSSDEVTLHAKIIATLMAKATNDTYKMLSTSMKTVSIPAGSNYALEDLELVYDGSVKADCISISVVSVEGNDRTGGLIAEPKEYEIPDGAYTYLSGWITAEEAAERGLSTSGAATRTEYRSRTNVRVVSDETKSTALASMGYSLLSSRLVNGTWSSWSDTKPATKTNRVIESKQVTVTSAYTAYRYGCWTNGSHTIFCPKYGKSKWGGTWSTKYTGWSKTRTSAEMVGTSGNGNFCPYKVYGCNRSTDHIKTTSSHNNSSGQPCDYWQYKYHPTSNGDDYYWEETKTVAATYKTQYRYRDDYYVYKYYVFTKGKFSDWQAEPVSEVHNSSQDIDVETRTTYNIPLDSTPEGEVSGSEYSIEGSLENSSLSGKNALILVYKEKNSDPTESQLEYVEGIKLGENGDYRCTFVPKEEPELSKTGDYVVALAVEGSNNYLNVDMIKCKRPEYIVSFYVDDKIISESVVEEGENADAPDNVEKEGYDFIGWDRNLTNVKSNMNVLARFKEKEYFITFVDYENRTLTPTRQKYNSPIVVPEGMEHPTCEGFEFDGWDFEEGATVTDDTVIKAKWIPQKFTVNFYDLYGNIINTQSVSYGKAASLPLLNVSERQEFLGWREDTEWWSVKEDMNIYPIVAFKDKLVAPVANVEFETGGTGYEIELISDEDATIYYTIDGSDPNMEYYVERDEGDEETLTVSKLNEDAVLYASDVEDDIADSEDIVGETFKYEAPIVLDDSCVIRAIAVKEDYEDSEIAEFMHTINDDNSEVDRGELREISREYVKLKAGDIISAKIGYRDIESMWSSELLINPGDIDLQPNFTDSEMGVTVNKDFEALGDLQVETADEGGMTDIKWTGSKPITSPSNMLTLEMVVGDDVEEGYYPISLMYAPNTCLDGDVERLELEGKVTCDFSNEGIKTVSGNSIGFSTSPSIDEIARTVYEYTNTTIKPIFDVFYNGEMLTLGKDYVLAYKNAKNIYDDSTYTKGKAPTVVISGKGNYAGKNESIHFMIDYPEKITIDSGCRNIKGYKVSITDPQYNSQKGYTYTGKEIRPEIEVYKMVGGIKDTIEKTDYVVTYSGNVNAGKATIMVTSRKNPGIKLKSSFVISPVDLTSVDMSISTDKEEYSYNAKGVVPKVSVSANSISLNQGKDFNVKYVNNKTVGTCTYGIVGKGNYKGSISNEKTKFKISRSKLENGDIAISNLAEGIPVNKYKVCINDENGKAIKPSNYEVSYEVKLKDEDSFRLPASLTETFSVGDIVRVTASAKFSSYYEGKLIEEFSVGEQGKITAVLSKDSNGKPISKEYDGHAITLEDTDINVSFVPKGATSGETLHKVDSRNKDGYMIVLQSNNVGKGTAVVYVVGCGKYSGMKKVTFKINPRKLSVR